jgi:N-acetylmuramoyl-L-alanine amidase
MAHRTGNHASAAYEEAGGAISNASRLLVIVSCIAAIGAMLYGVRAPDSPAEVTPEATLPPAPGVVASPAATASSVTPSIAPLPSVALPASSPPPVSSSITVPHIGIVVGHWESDTGAMCPDGLTEVEINLDVAQRVVYSLLTLGYQADLLKEFDPRLEGYQADALISIHADSCEPYPNATPPASGFKVASVEDSLAPEEEKRLVACLAQCYAARTGMYFHANSITYDMTRYHTFYEIDGQTPGAIIETGFMYHDRELLTQRPDLVAQGIVDGIVCFIEREMP